MTLVPSSVPLHLALQSDAHLRAQVIRAASTYDVDALIPFVHAYLATGGAKASRTSPHTYTAYASAIRRFIPWAQDNGITLLHPGARTGGLYLAYLQTLVVVEETRRKKTRFERSLKPRTIQKEIAGARSLYRMFAWANATDADPFRTTRAPADPTPAIVARPPYRSEVDAALAHCDPHEAALLLLCAHAGLRINEALELTWRQVGASHLTVHGKGGKTRRVPMSDRLRQALLQLPRTAERVLPYRNYWDAASRLKRRFQAAGAGNFVGFHAARKQAGTRLYSLTKEFTRVSLFLGHASETTTRAYVEVEDHDLSSVVKGL